MSIKVTYQGKTYDLEYSRQSVKTLEEQGFVLDKVDQMPYKMITLLWQGAFLKNHRAMPFGLIEEIYDHMSNKTELIKALVENYAETLSFLTEDDNSEGNATWELSR